MVNRIAGMKLVLGALAAACPALANVCALLLAVFCVFAILGLSLFMGKFYSCNRSTAQGRQDCLGYKEMDDGYVVPQVWANPNIGGYPNRYSFDNVFVSLALLFEVPSIPPAPPYAIHPPCPPLCHQCTLPMPWLALYHHDPTPNPNPVPWPALL